jgi:hypothetical protein
MQFPGYGAVDAVDAENIGIEQYLKMLKRDV